MSTSQDEARKYLLGLLPPGVEKLYDLEPNGDFYFIFDAVAELLRSYGFNLLDRLRTEQFPSKVIDKLVDWERFLGISRFFIARFGTTAQRQQSVVSKIRERGPFIDTLVQAVLAPLLGYDPTTTLEVLRASRSALRFEHTYTTGPTLWSIADTVTDYKLINVHDGGKIAKAGARVLLEFGAGGPYNGTVTLTAPDGTAQSWTLTDVDDAGITGLYGKTLAGASIRGLWTITVHNTSGAAMPVIVSFFVEGIARNQNTAGAVWHWGVYADPAHVGELGFSDFEAVLASMARIKHTHDVGSLVISKEPWPGVESGLHAAIPGRCIPSAAT